MINSKKGNMMFNSVSPIYEKNEIMKSIFEAIGSEEDLVEKQLDDIMLQLFPQTATWGLIFWERRLKVPVNLSEDIKVRRAKIISKLKTKDVTINPKVIERVINNFTKAKCAIEDSVAPYVIGIDLKSENGFKTELKPMYKEVRRIVPSHLDIKYKLLSVTKSNLYNALIGFTGEIIRVYPWTPNNLNSKANVYIPITQHSSLENIKTYPKEA